MAPVTGSIWTQNDASASDPSSGSTQNGTGKTGSIASDAASGCQSRERTESIAKASAPAHSSPTTQSPVEVFT
jgi:hypothetical protein